MIPASKFNNIIKQINDLASKDEKDEFTARRISRDAHSLMKVNPQQAYSCLGMLETLMGNLHESRDYHRLALEQNPESAIDNYNYAASLYRLGLFKEAANYADKSIRYNVQASCDDKELNAVGMLISSYWFSGSINKAKYTLETNPGAEKDMSPVMYISREIAKVSKFMKEHQLTDEDIQLIDDALTTVLKKHGLSSSGNRYSAHNSEDCELLAIARPVNLSPIETASLNIELANDLAMIEDMPPHVMAYVSSSFTVMEA